VARFDRDRIEAATDFAALAGTGQIVVTIEAERFSSRYQGIVPIDSRSLAASLEHYFESSEQLPTRVVLAADDAGTAGVLIQRLPQQGGIVGSDSSAASAVREAESWASYEQACEALQGIATDELLARSATDLMQRIFTGLDLRLFDAQPVRFRCRCSVDRVSGMLRSLGAAEVDSIIAEQGAVTVTCEFCHKPWRFDSVDVARLFGSPGEQIPGSNSVN
jgi:molecular chaperone Hsp33